MHGDCRGYAKKSSPQQEYLVVNEEVAQHQATEICGGEQGDRDCRSVQLQSFRSRASWKDQGVMRNLKDQCNCVRPDGIGYPTESDIDVPWLHSALSVQ